MNESRFTGKAQYYAKYRPSYPTVLADRLYELTHAENVADIGAGTGKFTEKLLAKPWRITAVEPNADMCRELLKCVGGRAEIVTVSAEDTGLAAHSFGLITAAQSFHWFDAEKFRKECKRLLTADGRLAVIWNSRYMGEITEGRDEIFRRYCPEYSDKSRPKDKADDFLRNEYFSSVEVFQTETPVMLTREQFIGDALSRSFAPRENDECCGAFVEELRALFDLHHRYGKVTVSYKTTCYTGKF